MGRICAFESLRFPCASQTMLPSRLIPISAFTETTISSRLTIAVISRFATHSRAGFAVCTGRSCSTPGEYPLPTMRICSSGDSRASR